MRERDVNKFLNSEKREEGRRVREGGV